MHKEHLTSSVINQPRLHSKPVEIIEILSDDEELQDIIQTKLDSTRKDYIEEALLQNNLDEMKKAIFRALTNVYPKPENL